MTERPGDAVSSNASSGLQRALHDVEAIRLMGVPGHLVRDNHDPMKVQAGVPMLYLAWALGVNLWEDTWSDSWQRQWMRDQWIFKAYRGTLRAFDMALAPSGYEVVDERVPPQGFFAAPDVSKEQMDEYVRLLPQIRIKFASKTGVAHGDEWYVPPDPSAEMVLAEDEESEQDTPTLGFADDAFVGLDDGPVMYGRKAVIRYANGTERDVELIEQFDRHGTRVAKSFERYRIPLEGNEEAFFADVDAADDRYVFPERGGEYIFTAQLDTEYEHNESELALIPLGHGMDPITVRYERDSDLLPWDEGIYADDTTPDVEFVMPDLAAEMLADRVYLFDPAIPAPTSAGVSFADIDRVGMPRKTIELMVDTKQTEPQGSFISDESSVEDDFAIPEDYGHIERTIRAVRAAKALRDTVHVTWETQIPLSPGDTFNEATLIGEWRKALL